MRVGQNQNRIKTAHELRKLLNNFYTLFYFGFFLFPPVFMLRPFRFLHPLQLRCRLSTHCAARGLLHGGVRLLDFEPGGSNRKISGRALDALQRGEQPVGAVPVHAGDLHWLVSVWAEVLQGEERQRLGGCGYVRRTAAAAADELSLRHQDLPQVYTVHLLCAAETTVPLG